VTALQRKQGNAKRVKRLTDGSNQKKGGTIAELDSVESLQKRVQQLCTQRRKVDAMQVSQN
jgi:hypothetical protein